MFHKVIRLIVAAVIIYVIAGCGAVEEASTEGANAVQSGLDSADKAEDIGEKKEAFDEENDF